MVADRTNLPLIFAVDHGTSGMKGALVTVEGQVVGTAFFPTPTLFLPNGGAEQDPAAWTRALTDCSDALRKSYPAAWQRVVAVCVSSTFSSTVAVDSRGRTLGNCLTWMDSRGAPYVQQLMRGFPAIMGYGLHRVSRWVPSTGGAPSLSGKDDLGHVLYWKHGAPDLYDQAATFLPSKDYLNLWLTGRTAASYDSMTLFWVSDSRDIHDVHYDRSLLEIAGIPESKLPSMVPSTAVLDRLSADASRALGLPRSVQVVCGSPDHQCAGIGAGAVMDFDAHLYIGTSSWIQCSVPFRKTSVAHSIASLPTAIPGRYYCANEQDMAGGALDFLVRIVGLEDQDNGPTAFQQLDQLAMSSAAGAGGVLFGPWLNGERTPVDDPNLRGTFVNLSAGTTREQMARAVFEGVACNTRWSLGHVETFVRRRLSPITIVGGGAQSDFWCQLFADVLGRTLRRPLLPKQANARGAAFIAAVGLGYLDFKDIPALMEYEAVFESRPELQDQYGRVYSNFKAMHTTMRPLFSRLNSEGSDHDC